MTAQSTHVDVGREARGNFRRILISLVVVGLVAAAAASTFAGFTAQTTNFATVANATVTITNVSGTGLSGLDCTSTTAGDSNNVVSGTCKVLFTANNTNSTAPLATGQTNLKPGDSTPATNSVVITYTGSITTSDFRLYASTYASKDGLSSGLCTAADPAAALDFQILQGSTIIFPTGGVGYSTLAAFATTYTTSGNGLQLKQGANGGGATGIWNTSDSATFTTNVKLQNIGNTYQGCRSTVTFAWYATQ